MTATVPEVPTAAVLLAELRRLNPAVRYAAYRTGSAVGEWSDLRGAFVPIYERTIDNRWVCNIEGGMIRLTLVNGRDPYDAAGWEE